MNAITTSIACPNSETLASFNSGRLQSSQFDLVAEHIDGCQTCQSQLAQFGDQARLIQLLRESVEPASRNEQNSTPPETDEYSDSRLFGDYLLRDPIGRGGMGQVFRADHRRMKRTVAIKVLPAAAATSRDAVLRFQREVEAAAKLNHPNIVTAYDAGESQGRLYLVMEYVQGLDLAALVKLRGPLQPADAVRYIIQIATALEYAHARGVVHRDIKPSNILVSQAGNAKLLDLGLARLQPAYGDQANDELTRAGHVIGTADYMAPEQARNIRSADERADIYGLGCTLFYLLTGRPPYRGEGPMATLVAHFEEQIPSLRAIRSDVSKELEQVFRKMVAKDPQHRCQTMSEVISCLQQCPEGEHGSQPVPPPPPLIASKETSILQSERRAAVTLPIDELLPAAQVGKPNQQYSMRRLPNRTVWIAAGIAALSFSVLLTVVIVISRNGDDTKVVVTEDGEQKLQVLIGNVQQVKPPTADTPPLKSPVQPNDSPPPAKMDEPLPTKPVVNDEPQSSVSPPSKSVPLLKESAVKVNSADSAKLPNPLARAMQQLDEIKSSIEQRKRAGDFGTPPVAAKMQEAADADVAARQRDGRLPVNLNVKFEFRANGYIGVQVSSGPLKPGTPSTPNQSTPSKSFSKQGGFGGGGFGGGGFGGGGSSGGNAKRGSSNK